MHGRVEAVSAGGLNGSTGGVIGKIVSSIELGLSRLVMHGDVLAMDSSNVGGVIGYIASSDISLFASAGLGNVTGFNLVGGLIGKCEGEVDRVYSEGGVIDINNNLGKGGGLIGQLGPASSLRNCFSLNNVIALASGNSFVGGLVGSGLAGTSIENCYTYEQSLIGDNPQSFVASGSSSGNTAYNASTIADSEATLKIVAEMAMFSEMDPILNSTDNKFTLDGGSTSPRLIFENFILYGTF